MTSGNGYHDDDVSALLCSGGGFDVDLLRGRAREGAFARLLTRATFEHKFEPTWRKTGNTFVEVSQHGGRPSGIEVSEADWWVIEFYPDCRLILPTRYVRDFVCLARQRGKPERPGGDNDNRGYVIPLSWFTTPLHFRNAVLAGRGEQVEKPRPMPLWDFAV